MRPSTKARSAPLARRHRGLVGAVATGVLGLSGAACIGFAVTHQDHAPQPPLSVAPSGQALPSRTSPPTRTVNRSTSPSTRTPHRSTSSPTWASLRRTAAPPILGPVLPASAPQRLIIPAIRVDSALLRLGQTAAGAMQVPAPGPHYNQPGWYRYSPAPGSPGPAVITGHVDSAAQGPSVFFRLGALRPGDTIRISRADGSVAVFAVDAVRRYSKKAFPTKVVYGDTNRAALRLITCGGSFDASTGHYVDNIVVLASLVRTSRATTG